LKKQFLTNITILVASNVLIKPLWIFGIDRTLQLQIGDTQYGLYIALLNLCLVFGILLDMGFSNYSNRLLAQQPEAIHTTLPNILMAKAILSVAYISIVLVTAISTGYSKQALYWLVGIAGIQVANGFMQYLRTTISAMQLFATDAWLSIIDKILVILAFGILLITPSLHQYATITIFIVVQIIAYCVAILICLLLMLKYYGKVPLLANFVQAKQIIIKSLPLALLILLMTIYTRSDMFLLERLSADGSTASGWYQKSYRILDALNMVGYLLAGMLLPYFAKILQQRTHTLQILKLSTLLFIPGAIAISIIGITHAHSILQLIYGNATVHITDNFKYVIATYPALCLMNIYSTYLTAANTMKPLIIIATLGALLSVCINLMVLPTYGLQAVGIVACMVLWLVALLYTVFTFYKLHIKLSTRTILLILYFIVMSIGIAYVLHTRHLIWHIFFQSVVLLGLYYQSGLVSVKSLKQLLKQANN
jgi:O-antigen/teichoic acid export membrane protein